VRPANYLRGQPGRGVCVVESAAGMRLGVINLSGSLYLRPGRSAFVEIDGALRELGEVEHILVDMHAEATSEKIALGWHLDGRVSAVVGTHTHVPTADARVLPGGTAYITDVGMTGPSDGVIGMETAGVLQRFTQAYGERFSVQKTGPRQFCAVVATVEVASGRALDVKRINLRGLA
jgi:hypothetical protein